MINEENVRGLISVPASDLNYRSILLRSSIKDIEEAIDRMIESGGKHKGRINACERELKRRSSHGQCNSL